MGIKALTRHYVSVAKHFLLELPTLLCFERQCSCRAGNQPTQTDGFACFITKPILAILDSHQGLRNFLEQFALTVARAQLQGVFFFDGGAVGRVRHDGGVFSEVLGGFASIAQ